MTQVFAQVGQSLQVVGGECPEGFVVMVGQRPGNNSIAQLIDGLGVWVEPPSTYRKFYGNEKLDLFTMPEQLAVVTATQADPEVKLMYDRLLGAAFLTYEDPEVEQGLQLLVTKGLLMQERKVEIVDVMGAA